MGRRNVEGGLVVRDLWVSYRGASAVRGVSFSVEEGDRFAIVGRNGAGKTTVLRAVMGVVRAQCGTFSWSGKSLRKAPHRRAQFMRYVPETGSVFNELSVRDNLRSGALSVSRSELAGLVEELLWNFPVLQELLGRTAGVLSGGQRQMVALARALAGAPELLLVDEPTLGLAPAVAQEVLRLLRTLSIEKGFTLIVAEQSRERASLVCDRAVWLEAGEIVGGLDSDGDDKTEE